MDHRITIRRLVAGVNEFNEPIDTWTDVATLYAEKREMFGGEALRSDEVSGSLSARFRVRYSSIAATIDARDRVLFEGQELNIIGIKRTALNRWLEIDAVKKAELIHSQYIVTTNGDRIVTVGGDPLVTAR